MINDQIYITSLYNAVEKAKRLGRIDIKTLQLFDLYRYYIDFTDALIASGNTTFNDYNVQLKKTASDVKYKHYKEICSYKTIINNDQLGLPSTGNTAPTLDNASVDFSNEVDYQFTVGDFLVNFSDAENDKWKYLLIYPLTLNDASLKQGTNLEDVVSPIIIDIEGKGTSELLELYIKRIDDTTVTDSFNFRVSDDNESYLYSALKTMSITAAISSDNQPPADIGDNTIYTPNRSVTTLTLFMFVGGLKAPYNDPEGDLIDAIKIVDISNANSGIYYLNAVPITEGQIITREDIEAGLFTHEGPDQDAVSSDTFQFQARDEGSQIWVD